MSEKSTIEITKDGPLIVKGLDKLSDESGELEVKEVIALCRCGASKNKPYCDGAHKEVCFKDDV